MNLLDLAVKITCDDQASSQVEGIGSRITGTLRAAAGVAAAGVAAVTGAVSAVGGAALSAYADYEQLVGGVDTLFKESSKTIQQYAAQAYQTAGVSANTYMEQATAFSASLIQSLGGDTAAAAEYANTAIMDISDNANKLGTDIESIQQTYQSLMRGNYAMLDNLKLGYGGTKSELERLVKDAEKLTGQALDPSKFSDVITAIHAVQENLAITGTTAREAATTIEGSVNQMKASWSNWLAGLGNEDADMGALTEQLIASIGTVGQNVIPRVQQIASSMVSTLGQYLPQGISALGSMIGPALSSAFQTAFTLLTSTIPDALSGLLTSALPSLQSALSHLWTSAVIFSLTQLPAMIQTAVPQLVTGLMTMLTNAQTQLAANVPTIMQMIVPNLLSAVTSLLTSLMGQLPTLLMSTIGLITSALASFASTVGAQLPVILPQLAAAAFSMIANLVTQICTNLPTYIGQLVAAAISLFQGIVQAIPQVIPQVVQGITSLVQTVLSNLPSFLGAMIEAAVTLFNGIVTSIPQVVPAVLEGIASLLQGVWDAITSFDLVGAGVDLIQGLIDGIASMAGAIIDTIGGVVGGAIDWAKGLLGIGSPSKLFHQYGHWTMQGFDEGLQEMIPVISQTMRGAMDEVSGFDPEVSASVGQVRPGAGYGTVNNYYIGDTAVTTMNDREFADAFVQLMQRYGRLART